MGPGTQHEAALLAVLAACQKTGKAAGKHCFSPAEVSQRIAQGFQYLALSSDVAFMARAAREDFAAIDFTGKSKASAEVKGSLY